MSSHKVRSSLRVVERKGSWWARGSIPIRTSGGKIARKRAEYSLAAYPTRSEREKECHRLNRHFEAEALNEKPSLTFARAYLNYIDAGNDHPLKGEQIVQAIGNMQCVEIDDTVMARIKKRLFDEGAKPSHVNRNLYTPVIAILNMAAKITKQSPMLTRPKGHKDKVPIVIPDADWFKKLYPHLMVYKKDGTKREDSDVLFARRTALVAFLTAHGRRLGDALKRKVSDFDPVAGTLYIGRDKTGAEVLVELVPLVLDLFKRMVPDDAKQDDWLFGWAPTSAASISRDIRRCCARAEIPWYSAHKFGRHVFATRMLRAGYSLQYVKEAGGWATIEMVSERYGHLAVKEVTSAVHDTARQIEFGGGGEGERKKKTIRNK